MNRVIALCVVLWLPATGNASQPVLDRFFEQVVTLQASFEQRVVDESGMLLEQSRGTFSLARPGKFRWDYYIDDASTDVGQQIVADGDYLFIYDPELEQMTQSSLADALGQVPSLLLAQSGANVKDHFVITHFGLTDGLTWSALKPRDEDAGYQQLMLGFSGELIAQIVLLDGLGNETRLALTDVVENPALPAARFQFEPPQGTDILFQ